MKGQSEGGANLNQDRLNRNYQRFLQLENLINQRHNQTNNHRQLERQRLLQLQLPSLAPQSPSKVEQDLAPATRRIVRVATLKGNSRTFTYGRDSFLDQAVEQLEPDLKPVPPQPNCSQSMKIYEDHRLLAADFIDMRNEVEKLRGIREELNARLAEVDQAPQVPQPSDEEIEKYMVLQAEKESLLQFQEKLIVQLNMIKRHQNRASGQIQGQIQGQPVTTQKQAPSVGSSPGDSNPNSTQNVEDDWVLVNSRLRKK